MTLRAAARAVLLVSAAILAGCGDNDPSPTDTPPQQTLTFAQALAKQTAPTTYDPVAGAAWWADFASSYPKRDLLLPNNLLARQYMVSELEAAGFEVEDRTVPLVSPVGGPIPPLPLPLVHAIVATKEGTDAKAGRIALGAHFDTQQGTLEGAYDNGSGTAAVIQMCKTLAAVELQHTLVCLLFDGEEEGAFGSAGYLASDDDARPLEFYLGYDMVGLNWPGYTDWKMYTWSGAEFGVELQGFLNDTYANVLAFPAEGVETFAFNDRNSDEFNFAAANIPTLRFAGGRTASAYPQYHMTGDTVDFVDGMAGGRAKFEAGLGVVVTTSVLLVQMLDQTSMDEITATYG